MQWTPDSQAGFSTGPNTWLPVAPNYRTVNVQMEDADPNSMLSWYRKLIALRPSTPALLDGTMTMLNPNDPDVFAYLRSAPDGKGSVVAAVNMSAQSHTVYTSSWNPGIAQDSDAGDERYLARARQLAKRPRIAAIRRMGRFRTMTCLPRILKQAVVFIIAGVLLVAVNFPSPSRRNKPPAVQISGQNSPRLSSMRQVMPSPIMAASSSITSPMMLFLISLLIRVAHLLFEERRRFMIFL